jgi:hypothetical protein
MAISSAGPADYVKIPVVPLTVVGLMVDVASGAVVAGTGAGLMQAPPSRPGTL